MSDFSFGLVSRLLKNRFQFRFQFCVRAASVSGFQFRLSFIQESSVANWYIYIPDFTNLVYFLDRLVGEIMVWYMSLNLVYFYAFW